MENIAIKEPLTIDSLLKSKLEKYIWIGDSHEEHREAQRLFDYFLKKKIYINGFATNVKRMVNLRMYNKKIFDLQTLNHEEAIVFYDSMLEGMNTNMPESVQSVRIAHPDMDGETPVISEINREITFDNDGKIERLFCLESFWMFNHFVDKKIYVYGIGPVEREFADYLKLLDYDFAGFLTDEDDIEISSEDKNTVRSFEEILYEDELYVWAYDKEKAIKLHDFGFIYFKNFYIRDYRFDITINPSTILDINLGNSYLSDSKYPGFMVYGHERVNDFKIVALGGSTTDGTMYPFKSWPQLLYEELGENITVYNGGVCSYTSNQELVKMLRDVLMIKPDMIVVYDGYNDLAFNVDINYPFASLYLEQIFEFAKDHIENEDETYSLETKFPVCRGIRSQRSYFDNWRFNMQIMHAIAEESKISFYSFCQPILSSKRGKTEQEKNMLLSMASDKAELFKKYSFRESIAHLLDKPDYIHDLSHIFDDMDNVYMDVCHVWENGNKIIAQEIKKVIQSKIKVN